MPLLFSLGANVPPLKIDFIKFDTNEPTDDDGGERSETKKMRREEIAKEQTGFPHEVIADIAAMSKLALLQF